MGGIDLIRIFIVAGIIGASIFCLDFSHSQEILKKFFQSGHGTLDIYFFYYFVMTVSSFWLREGWIENNYTSEQGKPRLWRRLLSQLIQACWFPAVTLGFGKLLSLKHAYSAQPNHGSALSMIYLLSGTLICTYVDRRLIPVAPREGEVTVSFWRSFRPGLSMILPFLVTLAFAGGGGGEVIVSLIFCLALLSLVGAVSNCFFEWLGSLGGGRGHLEELLELERPEPMAPVMEDFSAQESPGASNEEPSEASREASLQA